MGSVSQLASGVNLDTEVFKLRNSRDLLTRLADQFDGSEDHVILANLARTLKFCKIGSSCFTSVSSEVLDRDKSCALFRNLVSKNIDFALRLLEKVALRINENGFTSFGKQTEMQANLKTIVSILKKLTSGINTQDNVEHGVSLKQDQLKTVKITLMEFLSRDYIYESEPKQFVIGDRLWSKLRKSSLEEVLNMQQGNRCYTCNGFLDDLDYSIQDACDHTLCVTCSRRIFSLTRDAPNRCPVCHAKVRAYTTISDVARCGKYSEFTRRAHQKSSKSAVTKSLNGLAKLWPPSNYQPF